MIFRPREDPCSILANDRHPTRGVSTSLANIPGELLVPHQVSPEESLSLMSLYFLFRLEVNSILDQFGRVYGFWATLHAMHHLNRR